MQEPSPDGFPDAAAAPPAGLLLVEGHAADGQDAAEVRLDQDPDREAAAAFRQAARGRADAALVIEARRSRAGADRPFGDRPSGSGPDGLEDVGLRDVPAADVVEPAVVRLAHDGIDRSDLLVSREAERPVDDGVRRRRDAQGVGQDDRRFERAELLDLGHAGELAVAVADRDPGRDLVLEEVADVRQNGRHARPDVLPFDERDLADLDPGDVGDGVERARRENADDEAEFPGPGPVSRSLRRTGQRRNARDDENEAEHHEGGHGSFLDGHGGPSYEDKPPQMTSGRGRTVAGDRGDCPRRGTVPSGPRLEQAGAFWYN